MWLAMFKMEIEPAPEGLTNEQLYRVVRAYEQIIANQDMAWMASDAAREAQQAGIEARVRAEKRSFFRKGK